MNQRKYRPECVSCLHLCTHICTGCARNKLRLPNEMGQDRWEPEEATRDDGLVVCDHCGHINSLMAKRCGVCECGFPAEWKDLPSVAVPPVGEWPAEIIAATGPQEGE